jgi:outer membrane immunogenic protein
MVLRISKLFGAAFGALVALSSFGPSAWAGGDLPPERPWSWAGPYIGIHAGWMQNDFDWAFNPGIPAAPNQVFGLENDTHIVGIHAGYQHQFGQFVAGVEVAFNLTGDSWASHTGYGTGAGFAQATLNDLLTVGARLGWAPSSQWMVYVSGGYAQAELQTRQFIVAPGFHSKDDHNGWYIGGGLDYALGRNLVFGIEYQHISLDTVNHCPPANVCVAGDINRHDLSSESDIIRARLTLKLSP